MEYQFNGDLSDLNRWLIDHIQPSIKYVVSLKKRTKKRTLDQNAQSHVWYEQLEHELPQENKLGWKRFCKLHFGVPILRTYDSEFRSLYDNCIKDALSYEDKLKAMDILPVTSRMTTEQLNLYLGAMQEHFLKHGVRLEFLNEA